MRIKTEDVEDYETLLDLGEKALRANVQAVVFLGLLALTLLCALGWMIKQNG
jgi:hypothetical protein